jgi:UV DNA damage endonuclease
MRIGYACLALYVPGSELKRCTMKYADDARLQSLTAHNLNALERMIDYNLDNGILLYRISSDLIPFGSSPVNTLDWPRLFADDFARIGAKIRAGGMRVSMHPGQYTVLGAPDEGVAARAVEDLAYHARVLDALGTGSDAKIILHLGGVYGDKGAALKRFEARFRALDPAVRQRVALENDERLYTIQDALAEGMRLNAPVVFDNLHHAINPASPISPRYWVEACRETWKTADGPQKIHYSQQDSMKKPGSHSATIDTAIFSAYMKELDRDDIDVMLEVKDKNLSAIKCALCVNRPSSSTPLEREWARYKYAIMEHDQAAYREISALFAKGQPAPPTFYRLVKHALETPVKAGSAVNAAQHVWGYFKGQASDTEKRAFQTALDRYQDGGVGLNVVKRRLYALSERYGTRYLLESYYFKV